MGIARNERADVLAEIGCAIEGPNRVTEGGVKALWIKLLVGERSVCGFGNGQVSIWGMRAVSRYRQTHIEKGDLVAWRERQWRGFG